MIDAIEALAIIMGFLILLIVIGGAFLWGRVCDLEHQLEYQQDWLCALDEDLEETVPDPPEDEDDWHDDHKCAPWCPYPEECTPDILEARRLDWARQEEG